VCTAHYDTPARSIFPNIMMPRNKGLFYAYQFVPIFVLLALSFVVATLIGVVAMLVRGNLPIRLVYISFLLAYYVIFYLMYFAFKNKNNYNDNTSGVATLLEIIDRLSPAELENVAFIFFDNEEKGLKGSKGYAKEHKDALKERLIVNFDCVGNGEHILFIATKGAETLPAYQALQETFLSKAITCQTNSFIPQGDMSMAQTLHYL
jgi:hypothetical protein